MVFFPTRVEYFPDDNAEDIFLITEDNVKIHGYWMPSESKDAPVLLSFHGNAENANMGLDYAKYFNMMNISVILADYRGYGKSEGSPTEKGTYIDAQAFYNYAIKKTSISNLFIHGRSLGGAVAVYLASIKKSAGLILESTLTTAEEVFGIPEKDLGAKYRSIDIIDKINAPTLIIHGVKDDIVPFWMGEKLYEKLHVTKEFYAVEKAGHNDLVMFEKEKYFTKIAGFINSIIKR